MRWYTKILLWPLLAVNFLVALLLIGCAYSPLIPVESMPLLSLSGLAMPFVLAANVAFLVVWAVLYRRFMLVTLIAFGICVSQIRAFSPVNIARQNPPEESFKLMSYNILSSNLKISTANKDNPMVKYLISSGADIICLQEFSFSALKKNKVDLFSDYPYKSYDVSKESDASARFLGCMSKYPILSVENIDFGTTSNGCAKYRIRHDDDTIVVYNCHLQSNNLNDENKTAYEQILTNPRTNLIGEGTKEIVKKLQASVVKRAAQIDAIIADMQQETSPYIIVCGDFNDSPISYTCNILSNTLTNAYTVSGNGPGFSYGRSKLYYRIDHIFCSSLFNVYDCTIDRSVNISDHYPILCSLEK